MRERAHEFFVMTNETVRIKRVSVERGSTLLNQVFFNWAMFILFLTVSVNTKTVKCYTSRHCGFLRDNIDTVELPVATTSPQRPVFQNNKIFPVISVYLNVL